LRSGCDISESYGGWTESEHQTLVKELKRAQTKGLPRSKLTETLVAQLPNRSAEEISRHEDWVKCLKSVSDRKKLQLQKIGPRFEECLQCAKSHLVSLRDKLAEERQMAEERERHELARAELHKALHLQRVKKIADLELKLSANAELKRQADVEREREEERRQQELQQTREVAERYKEEKKRYLEAQREAKRVREEEERRERKLQQEKAMPKIAAREELRRQKLEEMRRKEVIPPFPCASPAHLSLTSSCLGVGFSGDPVG
jgi:hypothetical protein